MPDPPAKGRGGGRRRSYIVLLIVLLVATGFSQTPPGRALLRSAGLAGPAGAYSELAFTAPEDLPRELSPGAVLPPLPFMVHNLTGDTRTYHWTVELAGSGGTRQAAAGQATLLDGGSITITPEGRVSCSAGPVQVTVRLDRHRSIGYRAACVSGSTGRQG